MENNKMTGKEAKAMLKKQREYRLNYDKEHYRTFTFKFNKDTQAEVIEKLENAPSKVDYLVGLILADIEKNKQ